MRRSAFAIFFKILTFFLTYRISSFLHLTDIVISFFESRFRREVDRMKGNIRKMAALLLAAVMAVSAVPSAGVQAEEKTGADRRRGGSAPCKRSCRISGHPSGDRRSEQ